jgi:hypothetical protein
VQAVLPAGGSVVDFYDEGGTLMKTVALEAAEEKKAA